MGDDIERPDLLPYANEKLGAAVQVLATHPGHVKFRLKAAAEHLVRVPASGLPTHLRQEYEAIRHELTKRPSKQAGYSPISSTLHRMRFESAGKLAERIFSLSAQVDYLCR